MEHLQLISLIVYVILAMATTVLLGRSLYQNGEVFIAMTLGDRTDLVKPINNVLLTGFYLINIAFVMLYMSQGNIEIQSIGDALSFLARKFGFVLAVLGLWHYGNIAILLSTQHILKYYRSWKIK